MKKVFVFLMVILVSLLITFFVFENLSWYHFGDIPTTVVRIRLILFFIFMVFILFTIIYVLKKRR